MKSVMLTMLALWSAQAIAADGQAPAPAPSDASANGADPTNTKVNQRDRADAHPTADDQNLTESDRKILQSVRRAVTKNDAISVSGRNVKIIVTDSKVTLRGPVKDEAEKARIAELASKTDGVSKVDNQLEVAAK